MAPQKEKNVLSLLNGPLSKLSGLKFKPELLQGMDSLYAFYHKQRLVQWDGFTTDGSWYDCGSHFGKQYVGGMFGGCEYCSQRMERF